MHYLNLGTTGPTVSAMGLGCMGMSEFYGPSDEAQSVKTLHHALEAGVTFFDTADVYGIGRNEQLVGRTLRESNAPFVLATKFGIVRDNDGNLTGVNGRPEYVHQCCDASLKRLGLNVIDLYYQHRVDPNVPIEETVGAMAELIDAGKVRHLGLSEAAPDTLRRACHVYPIAALQTEYSLWSREPEDGLLDTCRERGVGFVAYSPLGRGFLTGHIRNINDLAPNDWRRNSPRFIGENFESNLRLVDEVKAIAAGRNCTPAQIALAWLHNKDRSVVPIPGTRHIDRLDENLAAMEMELSSEEMAQIERTAPAGAVAGTRYHEAGMQWVNL